MLMMMNMIMRSDDMRDSSAIRDAYNYALSPHLGTYMFTTLGSFPRRYEVCALSFMTTTSQPFSIFTLLSPFVLLSPCEPAADLQRRVGLTPSNAMLDRVSFDVWHFVTRAIRRPTSRHLSSICVCQFLEDDHVSLERASRFQYNLDC